MAGAIPARSLRTALQHSSTARAESEIELRSVTKRQPTIKPTTASTCSSACGKKNCIGSSFHRSPGLIHVFCCQPCQPLFEKVLHRLCVAIYLVFLKW